MQPVCFLIRTRWPPRNQQHAAFPVLPTAPRDHYLRHLSASSPQPNTENCSIPFSLRIQCCLYFSFYQGNLWWKMGWEGVNSKSQWVPIARIKLCALTSFMIFPPPMVYPRWISQGCPVKISCQHLSLCDAKLTPSALWLPAIKRKDISIHACVFWVCSSVTEVL